jgi:hypothetical protein
MSAKHKDKGRLPPFVPSFISTMETPAWKALSMGARVLYLQLKRHHFTGTGGLIRNNNGKIYLSERDAVEELGCGNRDSIRRWFAELEHFGFIVKTAEGCLGINGKGKAPQYRLTELDAPNTDQPRATRDYEKWDGTPFNGNQAWRGRGLKTQKQNPGRETTSRVDAKQRPLVDAKQRPLDPRSGRETTSISDEEGGRETTSISRITTPGALGAPEGGERSAPEGSAVANEPPENRKDRQKAEDDIANLIGWPCLQEIPLKLVEDLCTRWLNGDVDQAELFELKQKYEPPAAVGGQRARVAGAA